MTTIDPRNPREIFPVIKALSDRKPYVEVKDLKAAAEAAADRKGGKR